MKKGPLSELCAAVLLAAIGYLWLVNAKRPIVVDLIIETVLFGAIGVMALTMVISSPCSNRNFRRFELFFGVTYTIVAIAFALGLVYLFQNPSVREITIENIRASGLLQAMGGLKSLSFVFMLLAWYFFYRSLGISMGFKKKIAVFSAGFLGYFIPSVIIMSVTGDATVLSLGLIVGVAIGLFALIAQAPSARYLGIIFLLFSIVHLWEFYIMGTGSNLYTGLNNPAYWALVMLYGLEIRRWIQAKGGAPS
ncbi:hypothetical protein [Thermococcus aciditolerans]|uniref:Uncharacterized protein n=1 Tax=Thermococcus aciditolerans TaxID=2598455 RepID=A0A5C0SQC0_9EURY|nr:hypothetical protein [Thermococcus aciditolerans]QEK15378.1 hypothetical protein FPV09_10055 [Thermococcus aciditolerans]